MKRVNGQVYTDAEWKRNQIGIALAGWVFVWGFILMIIFLG